VLQSASNQLTVATGDGSGQFSLLPPVPVDGLLAAASLFAGHFAGPNEPATLALLRPISAELTLLSNDGQGGFAVGPTAAFESLAPISSAATVDLGGDGWADLTVGSATGALHFLHNQAGAFQLGQAEVPVDGCAPTGIGVLASDGQSLELIATSGGCGAVATGLPALHLVGMNADTLTIAGSFPTGTDAVSLAVGELDGAPGDDVAIANRVSGDITVLRRVGEGLIAADTIHIASFCGDCEELMAIAIANLDGDAYGDIVLLALHPGPDGLVNRGMFVIEDALSDQPKWLWLGYGWTMPIIADLNGDGLDDIVTHDLTTVTVLLGE